MTSEIPDSARELIDQALPIIQDAELYRVTTADEYRDSAQLLQRGKAIRNELHAAMRSLLVPVEETEKRIRELFGPRIKAWDAAESAIKGKLLEFDKEQERIRRAEEERLQAIARAEAERIRKAEEEKARKARELADRQATEARAKYAARIKEARDEEEAQRIRREGEERAMMALRKGAEKADAALDRAEAAVSAPLPTVARQEVKVEGLSRRKTWKGVSADLKKVAAQAGAGNGVALSLLMIDSKSFQAKAKALGPELAQLVQGVVVEEERGLASGSR